MSLTRSLVAATLCCLALAAIGCSKKENAIGVGTVDVRMTDAPATIQAVHLVVREVAVNRGTTETSSWEIVRSDSDSITVDLLTLQNGVFTGLGIATVPSGHYNQVRLILGPGSTVTVDGVVHPLVVPSGLQTGVKIVGGFDVPNGGTTVVLLDFDADKSIHVTGNGTWMLQPVIRVMTQTSAGAIRGTVAPSSAQTSVFAISGADTVQRTTTESDGAFVLSVLTAGTYSVAFHPASGFRDTTLTGVAVTAGQTTDVGTVQLTAQ